MSDRIGAARRFACTADLIPAVLGGPSAPLDAGTRGYTADIQPDRVQWDLTPGPMPGHYQVAA